MNYNNYILKFKTNFDEIFIEELSSKLTLLPAKKLNEAIIYCSKGGKKLRPLIFSEIYDNYKNTKDDKSKYKFMSAIECIHQFSLVHDDLPALDNDNIRRGQPSCHIKFGEATAILVGDALLCIAFELLMDGLILTNYNKNYTKAMQYLINKIGTRGMIAGQSIEIEGLKDKEYIISRKTSDLFEASFVCGALCAGVDDNNKLLNLSQLAQNFGKSYQLIDDLKDEKESLEIKNKHKEEITKLNDNMLSLIKELNLSEFFEPLINNCLNANI